MWIKMLLPAALLAAAPPEPVEPDGRISISGPVRKMTADPAPGALPLIGIVADSQLQTRLQNAPVTLWRDARSDTYLEDVTIRPPALDWSARYLLEAHLGRLARDGAKVIFFLGDGANNGCHDEFLNGFRPARDVPENDRGVLRLLQDFRQKSKIPVYFVLGNHDFLGAGSSSQVKKVRRPLCDDEPAKPDSNPPLSRYEVIEAIDAFNSGNAAFATGFSADYVSTFGPAMRDRCLGGATPPVKNEHRRPGCHYAAVLDYPDSRAPLAQFLLVDTTDYVDVMPFKPLGKQMESVRGATSFRGPLSQNEFFRRHLDRVRKDIPLRFALMHYPVGSLTLRKVPWIGKLIGMPGYSQRFLDLFVAKAQDGAQPSLRQLDGFVLSGHTHEPTAPRLTPYRAFVGRYSIGELNVGSTTDYPNHAALVRVASAAGGRSALEYRVVQLSEEECEPVYARIDEATWKSFGIELAVPKNYREFDADRKREVFDKLTDFVKLDTPEMRLLKARCIGRMSSWVEHEHYPSTFTFPR